MEENDATCSSLKLDLFVVRPFMFCQTSEAQPGNPAVITAIIQLCPVALR